MVWYRSPKEPFPPLILPRTHPSSFYCTVKFCLSLISFGKKKKHRDPYFSFNKIEFFLHVRRGQKQNLNSLFFNIRDSRSYRLSHRRRTRKGRLTEVWVNPAPRSSYGHQTRSINLRRRTRLSSPFQRNKRTSKLCKV